MRDGEDRVRAQIAALQERFVAGLPDRLAQLEQAFGRWRREGAGLDEFHRLAHSLTGAGATFGCAALSQAARELESYLKALALADGAVQSGDLARIRQLLTALDELARQAAGEAPVVATPAPVAPLYLLDGDAVALNRLALALSRAGFRVEAFNRCDGLLEAMVATAPRAVVVQAQLLAEDGESLQTLADLQACQPEVAPLILLGGAAEIDSSPLQVAARLSAPPPLDALLQLLAGSLPAAGAA